MRKISITLPVLFVLLMFAATFSNAQNNSRSAKKEAAPEKHPSSFLISKAELSKIMRMKVHQVIDNKANRYLDGSIVMANSKTGDMQFMRLKLAHFRKAWLNIQVNGKDSTQVFIVSDDKSVFYKGRFETENVVMIKCTEDDIISE